MARYVLRKILPKGDKDDLSWHELFDGYYPTIQPIDPPTWTNDERMMLVEMDVHTAEVLQLDRTELLITLEVHYKLPDDEPYGTD